MKLLYQTHSPFARKALVFAYETGLSDRLIVEHHETSPTLANPEVFGQNPLGKVPVLIRDDAPSLFDSDVICAYFDRLHSGERLIPETGEQRWRALQFQSLAQGLCDSGVQLRWETVRRPEALRYPPLVEGYRLKIDQGVAWLEREIDQQEGVHIGSIALATALDWLDFRELLDLGASPRVDRWLNAFRLRPSMRATPLSGDTVDG